MENKSLFSRMDSAVLDFVNEVTQPFHNHHDLEMFCDILSGKRFQDNNVCFKLRVGSNRRLNHKMLDDDMPVLPYNEFKLQIRLTSKMFHLMLTLFHNEENKTEGFSYHLDDTIDSGVADETWVLPEGHHGRKPQLLFDEVLKLRRLNREIRFISELEPAQEIVEINNRFDKLMASASETEINWAINNELETEEKIKVLQYLAPERKLQILNNLKNANKN